MKTDVTDDSNPHNLALNSSSQTPEKVNLVCKGTVSVFGAPKKHVVDIVAEKMSLKQLKQGLKQKGSSAFHAEYGKKLNCFFAAELNRTLSFSLKVGKFFLLRVKKGPNRLCSECSNLAQS